MRKSEERVEHREETPRPCWVDWGLGSGAGRIGERKAVRGGGALGPGDEVVEDEGDAHEEQEKDPDEQLDVPA